MRGGTNMNQIIGKEIRLTGKTYFQNENFQIEKGTYLVVFGRNLSGKTLFAKFLLGEIPFDGWLYVEKGIYTNENRKQLKKKIGYFSFQTETFSSKKTLYEIIKEVEPDSEQRKKAIRNFKWKDKLNDSYETLSYDDKRLVTFYLSMIGKNILILDEPFLEFSEYGKKIISTVLKRINRKKITILFMTNQVENILLGKEYMVFDHGKVISRKRTERLLEDEKLLKEKKYDLPFFLQLSKKLMYYNAIDQIYDNSKELIDELWKSN